MINAYPNHATNKRAHALELKIRAAINKRPELDYPQRKRWVSIYCETIQAWIDESGSPDTSWRDLPSWLWERALEAGDKALGLVPPPPPLILYEEVYHVL